MPRASARFAWLSKKKKKKKKSVRLCGGQFELTLLPSTVPVLCASRSSCKVFNLLLQKVESEASKLARSDSDIAFHALRCSDPKQKHYATDASRPPPRAPALLLLLALSNVGASPPRRPICGIDAARAFCSSSTNTGLSCEVRSSPRSSLE